MKIVKTKIVRIVPKNGDDLQEFYFVEVPREYRDMDYLVLMHQGEVLGIVEDEEMRKKVWREIIRLIMETEE